MLTSWVRVDARSGWRSRAGCDSPDHRTDSSSGRTGIESSIETSSPATAVADRTTARPSRPATVATVSTGPSTSLASAPRWWHPAPGLSWQWQLTEPVDPGVDADVFDVDAFETPPAVIAELHRQGRKTICYLDVGSWEPWRPDADKFPPAVLGRTYRGFADERWLDIRAIDTIGALLAARLDRCRDAGFDAVEPDNVDGYANDTGFSITADDQLRFNRWIADQAHRRGLSVGLKNDAEQAGTLEPFFDWALTEDCHLQGWCAKVTGPFLAHGKAVFSAEYSDHGATPATVCAAAHGDGTAVIIKSIDLGTPRQTCTGS